MRRLLAFLILSAFATPSFAGWVAKGSSVSWGPSATYCDYDAGNNHLWCLNQWSTSTSTALLKIDLAASTATVVAGPSSSYPLHYVSLGVSGSSLTVVNSYDADSSGFCELPACSSWTTGGYDSGANPSNAGTIEPFGGYDRVFVEGNDYGSGSLKLWYSNFSGSPAGGSVTAYSYFYVTPGSGCTVNSGLYLYWGYNSSNGQFLPYGVTGSFTEAFANSQINLYMGGIPTQRQCFSDGTNAYNVAERNGSTWVVKIWDGGSSYGLDSRAISGDLRPGAVYAFDSTVRVVVWKTTGEAHERQASSISAFSAADIVLDSGYTVRGVWYESGMTAPIAIVSNGTTTKVLEWGSSSASKWHPTSWHPNQPLRQVLP